MSGKNPPYHLRCTELCLFHYKMKGHGCQYGDKCHMAHSVSQLRPPPPGHNIGHLAIIFEGKTPAVKDKWVADHKLAKEDGFQETMVRPLPN